MSLRFVSFLATDKTVLPGLLYGPDRTTKKAAVWLHGMGDNGVFYNPARLNALGDALAKNGIALLAFNNRGAHHRKGLRVDDDSLSDDERYRIGGTHYELIADCGKDIDGAADFLEGEGFSELYLLGHSTGANKICVYHAGGGDRYRKYVLAGPGDDIGLFYTELGPKRYRRALAYAENALPTDPLHIMPKYSGMHPFSAQSAYDILNPDGAYNVFPYYEAVNGKLGEKPLFKEYRSLSRPTLVIMGSDDELTHTAGGADEALRLLMGQTNNQQLKQTDFITVGGADHGFHDYENDFADKVSDWLAHG